MPEEDLHLSDQTQLQTYCHGRSPPVLGCEDGLFSERAARAIMTRAEPRLNPRRLSGIDRVRERLSPDSPHRKTVRHYHEPGDIHELTFLCYRRTKLLTNNAWRTRLSGAIDDACQELECHLAAFVYMPEHVHLLVWGIQSKENVSQFLARVKRPVSVTARDDLRQNKSRLLERLTIQERPGKIVFRFWQEGPGFDRNLWTVKAVTASLDYIHTNPVKRGLCHKARDWRWSSARFYEDGDQAPDPLLPKLTSLPCEFWDGP